MKNRIKFYGPTVLFGAAGLALRLHLLETGIDEKGLLTRGNVDNIALWALTAGFFLLMFLLTRSLKDGGNYRANFPKCRFSGSLVMAGGVLMLVQVVSGKVVAGPVGMVLGVLASLAMIFTGWCRFTGTHPNFLASCVLSMFLLFVIMGQYQTWSSNPQFHKYGMQLLCCVMLMLCAFHRACCDISRIRRKNLICAGMTASYLCLVCLSDAGMPGFYLAAGLWAAGSMCTMDPIEA